MKQASDASLRSVLDKTVEKMVVISTAHLSREEMDILGDADPDRFPLRIIYHEYGWIFHVFEGFQTEEHKDTKYNLKKMGLNQSFVHIFERLSSLGYNWVNFDADGTIVPDFVQYDHTPGTLHD